jgi:uncharacterized membrane protein YbjE (DUF340 family)
VVVPYAFDLYVYGGFAGGWLVGRWRPPRGHWVAPATLASVVLLVGLLGASFRSIDSHDLATVLPLAVAFSTAILGATVAVYLLLRGRAPVAPASSPGARPLPKGSFLTTGLLLLGLAVGYGVGRAVVVPTGALLPVALAILLALIGYGVELSTANVRRAGLPIASAVAGAVLAALGAIAVARLSATAAFATTLGFGWYSLAGPLVAARLGPTLGLLAFLTNFVRESVTMLAAPYAGRRLGPEGLAALGGATSMDTTLYFVVRYGDGRAATLALANGLTLTIAASLVVPLVLAL